MKLLDLINGAWAIAPDNLAEIQGIYATHLRGEKIDIAAIEARLGRPLANEQQQYRIQGNGVAVLPIEGVLAPKANLFMQISGGASTQMLNAQVESAIADPRVNALVLAIDSPGGSVLGTPELAATIRELSATKPIVAVTDGTMASAAYWLGSAANAVFASGPTVMVGSIGVVAGHTYTPKAGSQTTEITAGAYKRIKSSNAPLTAEGAAYMQSQVDHLYQVFVDTVAANRGTTPDAVLQHMADGKVFIGQQALDAGLIDGFATVDALVAQLSADPTQFANRRKAVFATAATRKQPAGALAHAGDSIQPEPVPLTTPETSILKDTPMDKATLERDHPALFAQLRTEFSAAAVSAELARQQGVRANALPGHDKLIEALATDGKTTPEQAAMAVLAAERNHRAAAIAAHTADAPTPVPAAAAPADTTSPTNDRATLAANAQALAAKEGISVLAALKKLGHA